MRDGAAILVGPLHTLAAQSGAGQGVHPDRLRSMYQCASVLDEETPLQLVGMSPRKEHQIAASVSAGVIRWLGPILLVVLITIVALSTEPRDYIKLVTQMQPVWLIVALLLQGGTYLSHAAVWKLGLGRVKERVPLTQLFYLSLSQQFINQTLPSVGLSGTAAVAGFLHRRGISHRAVALALGLNLLGLYLAHLLVFACAVTIIWFNHFLDTTLIYLTVIFSVVMTVILIVSGYIWFLASRNALPPFVMRFRTIRTFLSAVQDLPRGALFRGEILVPAIIFLTVIVVLDALTLWIVLYALGLHLSFALVFASHVVSSTTAMLLLVPGGIGVFEGSLTVMLNLFGLGIAPALAVSILFRGFTYWLPMIPGYLITQFEMRQSVGGAE
jgi:uncharacterized protein (TIRG00374 family)